MKKKERTPEECLDQAILETSGIIPFFWFIMVLSVGIELFGCLMPLEMNISMLCFLSSVLFLPILCLLLFETKGNKMVRRIHMSAYFPIRKKEFVMSKIKIVWSYIRIFWPAVGVSEVITVIFFDLERFLISMLVIPAVCFLFTAILLFIGTVGAKKKEM